VSDAVQARDPGESLPDGYDEPRSGVCKVMLGADGAILEVSEDPDDFRGLVALIAAGAERRGLSGRLVAMAAAPLRDFPEALPLLECRMRVAGQRGGEPPRDHWYADSEAFRTVLMGAAQWCLELAPTRGTYLQSGFGSLVAVDAREDLETQLDDVIAESPNTLADFVSAGSEAMRIVSFHPGHGRITLIDAAGALGEGDAWRASLPDQRAVLADQASRIAYAFVKRGSSYSRHNTPNRCGTTGRPGRACERPPAEAHSLKTNTFPTRSRCSCSDPVTTTRSRSGLTGIRPNSTRTESSSSTPTPNAGLISPGRGSCPLLLVGQLPRSPLCWPRPVTPLESCCSPTESPRDSPSRMTPRLSGCGSADL
jgi:hypothetical protein